MAALDDVNLVIPHASRVALVGANGAGKSTLLKIAAGLLRSYTGEVTIYGNPPGGCHHRVAYLEQRADVEWRFPITVRRMVLTGRYVHCGWLRRPGPADREIADGAMKRLGIAELADRRICDLSGGQQQRALLARALTQESDLLLFDEPLNAVDAATRDIVFGVIDELRDSGKSIVMATHDLGRLTGNFDKVFHFDNGRVRTSGHVAGDPACDECAPAPHPHPHALAN
jgi:manganese/zinc/iron transport system ATP- binding protein